MIHTPYLYLSTGPLSSQNMIRRSCREDNTMRIAAENFHFIEEPQFLRDLQTIEPHPERMLELSAAVEQACTQRVLAGGRGTGFTFVDWTARLMTWYSTSGTTVYLESLNRAAK